MRYYAVAEVDIEDPSWVEEYVANVTGLVEARGGRYLARTPRIEKLEGVRPAPGVFLIIEWPSKETADAFYQCAEYAPYRRKREQGASNEFALVAGEDMNRAARIPDRHLP
jgi:uncharacterized protein (DUF1330 family)